MATQPEILEALSMVLAARLNFFPRSEKEVTATGALWFRAFESIPGEILKQAAADYCMQETDFPQPVKLVGYARKVRANNGRSVIMEDWSKEQSTPEPPRRLHLKGTYICNPDGWTPTTPPETLPLPHKAYEEMYALLDEFGKIDQPTEAQIEALEAKLAGYQRQGVMA